MTTSEPEIVDFYIQRQLELEQREEEENQKLYLEMQSIEQDSKREIETEKKARRSYQGLVKKYVESL